MIKNFIYLDVEKLHSLSSQIFEGVTEYVLNESSRSQRTRSHKKDRRVAGRFLAKF